MFPATEPEVPPFPMDKLLSLAIVMIPECVLFPNRVIGAPTCNISSEPLIFPAMVSGVARLNMTRPLFITAPGKLELMSVIS